MKKAHKKNGSQVTNRSGNMREVCIQMYKTSYQTKDEIRKRQTPAPISFRNRIHVWNDWTMKLF